MEEGHFLSLQLLSHHQIVASLSLIYQYIYKRSSGELHLLVQSLRISTKNTFFSLSQAVYVLLESTPYTNTWSIPTTSYWEHLHNRTNSLMNVFLPATPNAFLQPHKLFWKFLYNNFYFNWFKLLKKIQFVNMYLLSSFTMTIMWHKVNFLSIV